ncbi:MAG: class I SAM-dependent methyltransferase [Rhodopila sp.]|jgi:SAM-dependent methyltransferase
MLASSLLSLLKRSPSHPVAAALTALAPSAADAAATVEAAKTEVQAQPDWPTARLALVHRLWGPGFIFPGGEEETLRLARPLGVSNAASLLILGVGTGGPASIITRNLGAWVTGMDCDPQLLAAAKVLITRAQLTKKITLKSWDPENPEFAERSHHHCLALEPFHGARPEPILYSLARALRPGGQIVITELAAPMPLDPADHTVARWGELERRDPSHVISPVSVTRMLGRVGLDVRIAEDMSQRHLEQAMVGWREMLRDLGRKPTRQEAVPMVAEAELWLLRRRLIKDGRLRMMRWHAMSRTPVA